MTERPKAFMQAVKEIERAKGSEQRKKLFSHWETGAGHSRRRSPSPKNLKNLPLGFESDLALSGRCDSSHDD
jgi:hypothetical protein